MTYIQRIERNRRIREIIGDVIVYTVLAIIIFCVLWFTVGTHEVETYSFHAEITDKAVTEKYRSAPKYHIFWCDGEEAGCDEVGASTYARYRIGDLIEIEATVKQDWFGIEFTTYNVTRN